MNDPSRPGDSTLDSAPIDRAMAAAYAGPPRPGSVLDSIAEAIGPTPHILLRDTDLMLDPPMVRVDSPERPGPEGQGGRYQVLGEIARGGMGAILKGRDPDLGRDLALKVVLEKHRDNPDVLRRFLEEAQIGGQLQHPGIVPVYDLGVLADHRPFFAMKLVKGQTLASLLAERSSSADDLPRLLAIFEQVCQTVAYAHARGVVHRDLKPSNIMVGAFGEVQVMDWGLAKVLASGGAADERRSGDETVVQTVRSGSEGDASRAGSVLGTPPYMAPEQANGRTDEVDERADVFGLGSILCEILTGLPAYAGRSSPEVLGKARMGDTAEAIERLSACGADPDLVALAQHCLAIERTARPRDASAVAGRITAYLAGVQERLRRAEIAEVEARAEAERQHQARLLTEAKAEQERRARRLTVALAAVVLLAALGGGGTWLWIDRQARERQGRAEIAMSEARLLTERAGSAPIDDPIPWREARASARRAEDLLGASAPGPSREALADLTAKIDRGLRDATLVRSLHDALGGRGDDPDGSLTEAAVADAFAASGLDVDRMDAAALLAALRGSRPETVAEVATNLEVWASMRRHQNAPEARSKHLDEMAARIDPDPFRTAVRAALAGDHTHVAESLRRLAGEPRAEAQPPAGVRQLAQALVEARERPAAAALLRRARRRHPEDALLAYELARLLIEEPPPRTEEAMRLFAVAGALNPGLGHDLADLHRARGETDEAAAILERLVRLHPDMPRHRVCLGMTYEQQGRADLARSEFDAAIASAREVVRLHPNAAAAYNSLGQAQMSRGDPRAAAESYRAALRLEPQQEMFRLNLGRALLRARDFEAADSVLSDLQRANPRHAEAAAERANIRFSRGDYAGAILLFREALALNPGLSWALNNLGIALGKTGDYEGSAEAYRRAVDVQPDNVGARHGLGLALLRMGDREAAVEELRRVVKERPDLADVRFDLAGILMEAHRFEEALPELRLAIASGRLDPKRKTVCEQALESIGRLMALKAKLPAYLRGEFAPEPSDRLLMAEIVRGADLPARAEALYAELLAERPATADDPRSTLRYDAACCAARAGTGRGKDAPPPDEAERARLRGQARDRLRATLALWSRAAEASAPQARRVIARQVAHALKDPDLAGVRDAAELDRLPEAERLAWRQLWKDVEALEARLRGGAPVRD